MADTIYVMVLAYKMLPEYWNSLGDRRSEVMSNISASIKEYSSRFIHIKTYKSLRFDNDLIFWYSSYNPEDLADFKFQLNDAMQGLATAQYSMLSLYEHSPYLMEGKKLEDTLKNEASRYFVAYPMSKNPEWYLIDYERRKKIMAEHIGSAASNPESKGIRSYTTYSFGLGDQEFVVLYETDSLAAWSHVTGKLREVEARRWIVNETPILVGIHMSEIKF